MNREGKLVSPAARAIDLISKRSTPYPQSFSAGLICGSPGLLVKKWGVADSFIKRLN